MISTITFPTALTYWLKTYYPNMSAPMCLNDFRDICQLSGPIHIMVSTAAERRPSKEYIPHVTPKSLNSNSFVQLSDHLQIIRPELCFLMAAQNLSVPALVKLACEMCATYLPDKSSPFGQRNREPVTNVSRIQDYLKQCSNISGIKKASIAIRYALDRANSPAEVKLAVLSSLPRHYGGYSLEKPELNYNVPLSSEARAMLRRDFCCCDMVWPAKKIIVEYDSNLAHLQTSQYYYDRRRYNALTLSGYTVLTVTAEMINSFPQMERFFANLRKALGMRSRKESFEKYADLRWSVIKMFD